MYKNPNLYKEVNDFITIHQEKLAEKLDHKEVTSAFALIGFDRGLESRIDKSIFDLLLQDSIYSYTFDDILLIIVADTKHTHQIYSMFEQSLKMVLTAQEPITFYSPLDFDVTIKQSGLLVSDMDMTVIQTEIIDTLAIKYGIETQVYHLTELAMTGQMSFEESFIKRLKLLKGCKLDLLLDINSKAQITAGFLETLQILKAFDWRIAIASGGFQQYLNLFQSEHGIDSVLGNNLELIDSEEGLVLTGNIIGSIVCPQSKADFADNLLNYYDLTAKQLVAIGDGSNDIPMLQLANLAIGLNPKPIVQDHTTSNIFAPYFGIVHHLLIANEICKGLV